MQQPFRAWCSRMRARPPRVRGRSFETGEAVTEAAAFAEFLLRGGVEAYVGTYWQVSDAAAKQFAGDTYLKLAAGSTLADAVRHARRRLEDSGSQEWANYILYGDGEFKLVRHSRDD